MYAFFHHLTKSKNIFDEKFLPAAVSHHGSSRYILEIVLLVGVIGEGSQRNLSPGPDSILTASSMVFPQVREKAGCEQFHFFPAFVLQPLSPAAKGLQFDVLRFSLVTFSHQKLNLNPPACFLRKQVSNELDQNGECLVFHCRPWPLCM